MKVRLHDEVEDEIEAAFDWYQLQRESLGLELLSEYQTAIAKIAAHPNRWPRIDHDPVARSVRLDRFPFRIIYDPHDGFCIILAFMHTSRRPGYWQERR